MQEQCLVWSKQNKCPRKRKETVNKRKIYPSNNLGCSHYKTFYKHRQPNCWRICYTSLLKWRISWILSYKQGYQPARWLHIYQNTKEGKTTTRIPKIRQCYHSVLTSVSDSSIVSSMACSNSRYASHILLPSATCKPAAVTARSNRFLAFKMPAGEHSQIEGSCSWTKFM